MALALQAAINGDHGQLHQVGGRALNDRVHGRALGQVPRTAGVGPHSFDRAAAAEDRRHVALLAALGQRLDQEPLDARVGFEITIDEFRGRRAIDAQLPRKTDLALPVDRAEIHHFRLAAHVPGHLLPRARC